MKYLYLTFVRKYCNFSGHISSDDFFISILIDANIMFKTCSYITIQHYMKAKKFTILPHNSVFPDQPHAAFSDLQTLKKPYVIIFASPNKPSIQISVNASEIYLNQHTVTYFKTGFRDLNYVFQTLVSTLKRCNVLSRMLLRCKQALRICQHSNMHVFTYSMIVREI